VSPRHNWISVADVEVAVEEEESFHKLTPQSKIIILFFAEF